jgi:hypothetical protein
MKSLKIILSMVVLLLATQAINAQQSRRGNAEGKPERVKKMQLEKDAKKLEHHELKKERKAAKKSRKGTALKSDRKRGIAKNKSEMKRSRKGQDKVKGNGGKSELRAKQKGPKTQKQIKHKKRPAVNAEKE